MRRIWRGNGGFSLVELIVSLAILVIISGAVAGFLGSSTRAYSSVSSNVTLQFEAQTTMTQLKEYLIDCNYGVVVTGAGDDVTLFVVCEEDDSNAGPDVAHVFSYDSAKQCLYYKKFDGVASAARYTEEDGLMSSRMTSFAVDLPASQEPGATKWSIDSVTVSIAYQLRGKSYSGGETIALRNAVRSAETLTALTGG